MLNFDAVKQSIKDDAIKSTPQESCGVLIRIGEGLEYISCLNKYPSINNFILDPLDYANAEDRGEVVAIVHSHVTQGTKLSNVDIACMRKDTIPWIVYSVVLDNFEYHEPDTSIPEYLERDYIFGVQDCYTIIQDYYKQEYSIDIPSNPNQDPLDPKLGQGLYSQFEQYGFTEIPVKDLKKGDCIIMCIGRSSEPTHAGIYLGENVILHHPAGRLSSRDIFGGYWLKNTWKCVRHKDLA